MHVKIRPISVKYAAGFHAALDMVARERQYLARVEAPPLESIHDWVSENAKNNVAQFIALDADRVVGWCDIAPGQRIGSQHVGNLGMGVVPEYRRRGIGKALLSAALSSAKEKGFERVELEVFASNSAALALYDQFGFLEEGIKRKTWKLDERYDDLVIMGLIFETTTDLPLVLA